jgi:hypothetical protein
MNHTKTSFSAEIFAGAIISVVQYLAPLRYFLGDRAGLSGVVCKFVWIALCDNGKLEGGQVLVVLFTADSGVNPFSATDGAWRHLKLSLTVKNPKNQSVATLVHNFLKCASFHTVVEVSATKYV